MNKFRFYLSIGVLVMLMTSWVSAEPAMRYYLVHQGETLSGIAFKEIGDAEAWLVIQKHNDVPNPRLLMPGTKLKIPESLYQTNPLTALVIRVNGQATHFSSLGEQVRGLAKGDELTAGTIIETSAASNVVLQFFDNSRLFISENSRISLETLTGKTNNKSTRTVIKVEEGKTESRVSTQKNGAKYEVVTPEMRLAVRGTEFLVSVDANTNTSRVMVMEGRVFASQENVDNFQGANIDEGLGFIAKDDETGSTVNLLAKPELMAHVNTKQLSSWSASWDSVENEKEYRIQLVKGKIDKVMLADKVQESKQVNFSDLDDGLYELKVRAIDDKEMEGLADTIKFDINAFPIPPMLPKADMKGVGNKKITFNWQAEKTADFYHFQIFSADEANSYFSKIEKIPADVNQVSFRLVPGNYFWRVASVSEVDGQGPFSENNKIEVIQP